MKLQSIRNISIGLLLFLGISALVGSVGLLIDPTGESLGLPYEIREVIPFDSYLFPGILLGVFNGLLSLLIAVLVIRKIRIQGWLVLLQGSVLLVWMAAELLMKIYYPPLTIPYFVIGFLLALFGILLLKTGNLGHD
jgi:hypothetical protein